MNITTTVNGKDFIVNIDGRLDTATAPTFEQFINENIVKMDTLTLDCAGLEYVSSAGLRVLLSAQKKMQQIGKMKVINVCEAVMEVFANNISKLQKLLFSIVENIDEEKTSKIILDDFRNGKLGKITLEKAKYDAVRYIH